VTNKFRVKYHCRTCSALVSGLPKYIMARTLLPYFDWSLDAPTTAYRGEERKNFWISVAVRDMVDVSPQQLSSDQILSLASM
jgi:hypothetical protein